MTKSDDSSNVVESAPILKGFSTHMATVGAVTGAVSTSEEREPVSEVCTMQRFTDEETTPDQLSDTCTPHARLMPTVFVEKSTPSLALLKVCFFFLVNT